MIRQPQPPTPDEPRPGIPPCHPACPCQCHDGLGEACDVEGCAWWLVGGAPADPEALEPDLAAPPIPSSSYRRSRS